MEGVAGAEDAEVGFWVVGFVSGGDELEPDEVSDFGWEIGHSA